MRICSVSTDQFAGLRATGPVEFDPRLTILYGKNESGKSTLINLIYSLLWKDCKVGKAGKAEEYYSDRYFRNHFVPVQNKESTVYGTLIFEDESGSYKLEKSWDTEGTVTLRTPENIPFGKKDYRERMEKVLRHKNSVFSEILFANQKSIEAVVKKLLTGKMESGEELSTVATTLLMDLNGVPSEAFRNKIQEKMDVLGGAWDFRNDMPAKGGKKGNADSILKAFEDLQTAKRQLEELNKLVQSVTASEEAFKQADEDYQEARKQTKAFSGKDCSAEEFNKTAASGESLADLFGRMVSAEREAWAGGSAHRAVFWGKCQEDLMTGKMSDQEAAALLNEAEEAWEKVSNLENSIAEQEEKLRSFHAFIRFAMKDGVEYHVYRELDGMRLQLSGNDLDISEAVRIEIPGIGEIHLADRNVDVEGIQTEIFRKQGEVRKILEHYFVKDKEGLKQLKDRIETVREEQLKDSIRLKSAELSKREEQSLKNRDEKQGEYLSALNALETEEDKEEYLTEEELEELIEDLKTALQKRKNEYHSLAHIKEVAEKILEEAKKNPLADLELNFRKYLMFLTDGKVSIQELNRDLSSKLYSDDNQLTYELLSEGTKDVIALAFRLAAVELLYPDGGGVIAFDDPFTDMDEDRRSRACELINHLSERNQVIFATCDTRYFDLLHGRVQYISGKGKE